MKSRTQRRQRDRRSLVAATGAVVGLLLLTGAYLSLIGAGQQRHVIGGPFTLVRSDGRQVTERSFGGKYLLLYFGYTSCRDVCPTTLATLAAALDALGEKAREVQPLFITVDPEHDTPEVVGRYARLFMPQLVGLTGTPAELRRVAAEYRVSSEIHHGGTGDYDIDHSAVIYLVGRDGRYLAPLRADASEAELARAISRYL